MSVGSWELLVLLLLVAALIGYTARHFDIFNEDDEDADR